MTDKKNKENSVINNDISSFKNGENSKQSDVNKKREIGGQKGPEPTRYGDWEKAGRCSDF